MPVAPSKSVSNQTISWGILNIPVKIYSGTEETRVARKQWVQVGDEWHQVGRKPVDLETDEIVSYDAIQSFAISTDGQEVELTDDEVSLITGPANGIAAIESLVPVASLGTFLVPEKLYQLRANTDPKRGGKANEKAFGLLLGALESRQEAALIRFSIRKGLAKPAALLPNGDLYILHYSDAVRDRIELPPINYSEAELAAANALLDQIGTSVPDLHNDTAEKIQRYVDAKADGAAELPSIIEEPVLSVDDLVKALEESVAKAKRAKRSSRSRTKAGAR